MGDVATLSGIAGSPGTRRGPARVVLNASDFGQVQAGEILVTRFASPDVVLVFDRIVGLVTDQGGRFAHAVVVARELGVPAVVGTQDATERVVTGSVVVLNGGEGTVRVVSEQPD
jgi:phosphoenolpyruvate synthase/pyruvate phosphate dikinase